MANLTEMERKGIVRGLALALVEHMGVEQPPIWVESLLKDPPTVYAQRFPLRYTVLAAHSHCVTVYCRSVS